MKQTDALHHNIWRRSLVMKDLSTTVGNLIPSRDNPWAITTMTLGKTIHPTLLSRGIFHIGVLQAALGESVSLMTIQSKLDIWTGYENIR